MTGWILDRVSIIFTQFSSPSKVVTTSGLNNSALHPPRIWVFEVGMILQWPQRGYGNITPRISEYSAARLKGPRMKGLFACKVTFCMVHLIFADGKTISGMALQGWAKEKGLSWEKVSARLQQATAGHARLVLSKTVPVFCTTLYVHRQKAGSTEKCRFMGKEVRKNLAL